jgi:DNA ligase-1
VSKLLVQRALAHVAGIEAHWVAQRMMGWTQSRLLPSAQRYRQLIAPAGSSSVSTGDAGVDQAGAHGDVGQPYPFFLAHAWQGDLERLGSVGAWQVEWKYDGIRAQLVRRGGQTWIWSRGEELVTERFPEVVSACAGMPDGTVVDGELLCWKAGQERPEPFQRLQQRISRKSLTRKVLQDVPVVFMAYDLLEWQGVDLRAQPQSQRRSVLQQVVQPLGLRISPLVQANDWPAMAIQRQQARERGVEGLMLKHRDSAYGAGRRQVALSEGQGAGWWKWKVDPYTVDAVLIYAQAGHGRRASLYTDYTFAVWNRPPLDAQEAASVVRAIERREPAQPGALQLVPIAKAYSGLSQSEIDRVDREIRKHTLEKFGPVRSVKPTLVFELGFEGLNLSPRHKSGIAVRFPRILRIRDDKPLHEADHLEGVKALVNV